MSPPLTKIEGVPSPSSVVPGMAFFAGTGPEGKTCGDCAFRGYRRESGNGRWDAELNQMVYREYRVQKCAMFKTLSGKHGPDIAADNRACKYFQLRT